MNSYIPNLVGIVIQKLNKFYIRSVRMKRKNEEMFEIIVWY